jgi:hypothetical protein
MTHWNFEVCENWDIIWGQSYQQKWLNLLDKSSNAHVFFHPALVKAWADTYLPLRKIKPLFVWGKCNDNEVFFPLIFWRKNWKNVFLKTIVPAGYSDFDYHDPIFLKHPSDMDLFWKSCFDFLKRYDYDNVHISGIRNNCIAEQGWIPVEKCPYLNIENMCNQDDLMSFLKASLRGDIRRQIRRLNSMGAVRFCEYNDWDESKGIFPEFIKEHALRWPDAYKAPCFHENLLKQGSSCQIVHFSSLNVDNTPVSWHLGFKYHGIYYYYMPAGNHAYSTYSPAKVHLFYLLNNAIKERCLKFDHLRGEENYKSGWANGFDIINDYTILSNKRHSQIKLYFIDKIKNKIR